MPQRSSYKPEIPRKGTEWETTQRNIEQIFAILNRHREALDTLEENINNLVITVQNNFDKSKTMSLMMLDSE